MSVGARNCASVGNTSIFVRCAEVRDCVSTTFSVLGARIVAERGYARMGFSALDARSARVGPYVITAGRGIGVLTAGERVAANTKRTSSCASSAPLSISASTGSIRMAAKSATPRRFFVSTGGGRATAKRARPRAPRRRRTRPRRSHLARQRGNRQQARPTDEHEGGDGLVEESWIAVGGFFEDDAVPTRALCRGNLCVWGVVIAVKNTEGALLAYRII